MIQKRQYGLSNKISRPFYDMVQIRVIIMWNVNIFTVYEILLENIKTLSPIT